MRSRYFQIFHQIFKRYLWDEVKIIAMGFLFAVQLDDLEEDGKLTTFEIGRLRSHLDYLEWMDPTLLNIPRKFSSVKSVEEARSLIVRQYWYHSIQISPEFHRNHDGILLKFHRNFTEISGRSFRTTDTVFR